MRQHAHAAGPVQVKAWVLRSHRAGLFPAPRRSTLAAMIIDMHTHAGRMPGGRLVDAAALASMRPAGVAACVVAPVADAPVIRRHPVDGRIQQSRAPLPGECLAATREQLDAYDACGWRIAREPGDINADDPAIVLAIEGCDFLEGDLDRLDAMAARGVRSIQLVHYVINDCGDIQTEPEVHGGLTGFGASAVRRMESLGIIVDVAHATEAVMRGVARVATRPFLCSHANLAWPDRPDGGHKRFISADYARMVADCGGVVGAWIAILWQEPDPLRAMIEHMFRLIDAIGIDHVGIGTDMPAGAAKRVMPDFARHPDLAQALRGRGMNAREVEQVCAGNWLRVFRAARGG
jgi:membrane dipeptidase